MDKTETSAGGRRADIDGAAIVALGSNLGDSATILQQAILALRSRSTGSFAVSSIWKTPPVDCPPNSPDFLNAIVVLNPPPDETPESLLRFLHALERQAGRVTKSVHNEARPLDLDLIAFRRETRASPSLTLPHPRAHLRRFVLLPLVEIAPHCQLPGWTLTADRILAQLPSGSETCWTSSADTYQ